MGAHTGRIEGSTKRGYGDTMSGMSIAMVAIVTRMDKWVDDTYC